MSKYRASLSTGTRSGGQSASAKHRYQNRQDIYLVGKSGVRDDLAASGSGNLPAFADGDAGKFWLAVDSFERKNARLFVELQLNLPAELSLEQQKEAVQSYMKALCDKENLSYSWVIHHPKNGENQHAHVMISEQKNDSIDRPAEQHFMRWNSKHPERGGAQKSATLKPKQWLMDARAGWAIAANDGLEAAGFERRFDHRSLEDQRTAALLGREWRRAAQLDREVCEHEGPRVAGLRRKLELDLIDRLPDYAKAVIESNNNISAINAAHLEMVAGMTDAELELMERTAYFEALAEHEPERLTAELEQLHSEALGLDAQTQTTEQKHEHNTRSTTQAAERRTPDNRGIREHEQYLFIVQERRNNQILRDTSTRSESCEIQGRDGDVHYKPMAVRTATQSADRDARDGMHDVRGKRVTLTRVLDHARERITGQYRAAIERIRKTGRGFQESFARVSYTCASTRKGGKQLEAGAVLLREGEQRLVRAHRASSRANREFEQSDKELEQSSFKLEQQLEPLQQQRQSLDRATRQLFERINAAIELEDEQPTRNVPHQRNNNGPRMG